MSTVLDKVPTELLIKVFSNLNTQDLKQTQAACRAFRMLAAERLWANVELNLVTDRKSAMIREYRWTRDIVRDRKVVSEPWIVLNQGTLNEFFDSYQRGLLELVLPAIKVINIVETTNIDRRQKTSSNNDQKFCLTKLSPEDLPRLKLMRVSCAISGSMGLHFLRKFSTVEKYIWAMYSKPIYAQQYILGTLLESTTSLNLALGDIDESMVKSFAPVMTNLEQLHLSCKERYRCCTVEASILATLLKLASPRLKRLTLSRVEVINQDGIQFLPDHLYRLCLQSRDDFQRGIEPHRLANQPIVECPNVKSLYVNMMRGKDSLNLRRLEFKNLESLFYKAVQRESLDEQLHFDAILFRSNPGLKRVVYNCSSNEGVRALTEIAPNLEVLSLQRPMSRSYETLLYDLDAMSLLARNCRSLRFLSVSVSPRHMNNPIKVLCEFLRHCEQTLKEIYVISLGKFNCRGITALNTQSVNDGYYHQYLKSTTRQCILYALDVPVFRQHYLDE